MTNNFISFEEFTQNLKLVSYGRKYLEHVTNNQISPNEVGEDHHLYMRAICGDNKELFHLSYYDHIVAHILLAEAGLEGHFWWTGKALCAFRMMVNRCLNYLSDFEKITVKEICNWGELRRLGHIEAGKAVSKTINNRTEEEWICIKKNLHAVWTPEKRIEHSNSLRNYYKEHPEKCIERSEILKKSYAENPERHTVQSNNSLEVWGRTGYRDFMSDNMKQYDIEHPERVKKISNTMQGKNVDKTYVNNGIECLFVTQEEAAYYISIGWESGCFNSEKQKGSIFMTKEGEKIYQVIPRKQAEFYANGFYRCGRTSRELYKEKDTRPRHEKWLESMENNKIGKIPIVRNHGKKYIFPEELPQYITDGWHQKVA